MIVQSSMLILPTAELPWRNNEKFTSCIPPGEYECAIVNSPKFGLVYEIKGVPGRDNVLIHRGNYAGDKSLEYQSDVEGCVLLGEAFATFNNKFKKPQRVVISSAVAVDRFMCSLQHTPFRLSIEEYF